MTAQCAPYMGALQISETPSLCPRLLFPNFFMDFVAIDLMNVCTKFKVSSFTRS